MPGDIKSGAGEEGGGDDTDGKPKLHYAVQLALYIDILQRHGLSAGRRAFVWDVHGKEVPGLHGGARPEEARNTLGRVSISSHGCSCNSCPPDCTTSYASACKHCHWYTFCVETLTASDDLTLIPSLGRSLRDGMQDTVWTIADFAASNPEAFINGKKSVFQGLGPDRLKLFHARAVMLKGAQPRPFLRAPVALKVVAVELFFDIEVDPMRDVCYLHGFVERRNGDNGTERFVHFFAEEVNPDAEREAFAAAITYLSSKAGAAIYYYSKYERTIYRKLRAKYPDVCSADDIERLFDPSRAVDLYGDIVLKATEWPTRDHSIKTLAKYLGFDWRDTHPSGAASIEWFDRWCKARDPAWRVRQ